MGTFCTESVKQGSSLTLWIQHPFAFSFDDLVGGHLHDQRHRDAERLRRFEIDDEFDLGRLHHRKLGGLLTLENAIDIEGRSAELVVYIRSIRQKAARIDILA